MVAVIIGALVGLIIALLINAGLVWIICWGLKTVGITSIAGWTVAFSWPLVILFTVVCMVFRGIFSNNNTK